jgi:hypothetical protein
MRIRSCLTLLPLAMIGCASPPIVVVPPAAGCPVPAALSQSCAEPRPLPSGTSYGGLLLDYRADRASLAACAATQRDLVRLLAECDARLADYNASLGARGTSRP